MRGPNDENSDRRLRIGPPFSGYGGFNLAVEETFSGQTVRFSEINEPIERVFACHVGEFRASEARRAIDG